MNIVKQIVEIFNPPPLKKFELKHSQIRFCILIHNVWHMHIAKTGVKTLLNYFFLMEIA